MKEDDLRDYLYENHKDSISSLVDRSVRPPRLARGEFPKISHLLQNRTQRRIDAQVQCLSDLQLDGKEVQLARHDDSTTRVDLLGHYEEGGSLVIIELKSSRQTERQSFTQLLAYANHFCTFFPPLSESSLSSVLVAPMEGRGVRDALAQELIINNKNILALQPTFANGHVRLAPYYPGTQYYRWIENSILADDGISVVVASFPSIDGWIDGGEAGSSSPPEYTRDAFQQMTASVAQRMEAQGLHGFVFARQHWRQLFDVFPHPNAIILCLVDPFSSSRADIKERRVGGASPAVRLQGLQRLVDQLDVDDDWFHGFHRSFGDQAIRIVLDTFEEFFNSTDDEPILPDLHLPLWDAFKVQMLEAVTCHNMHIRTTGIVRFVVNEYLRGCYASGNDQIFFSDDLPKYQYCAQDHFLAIWTIVEALSRASPPDDGST